MKRKECKKFREYIESYKVVSNANKQTEQWWIDEGRYYPKMQEEPDFEWSEEVHRAEFNHGVFIKLVGSKFDEGKEAISKFTFLLHEYFTANNGEQPEYQEIKDKWGYLIDFNALNTNKR